MFELCLLAIAWGLDPVAIQPRERSVVISAATMVRPAALVAEPGPACACSTTNLSDPQMASTWLRRWEQASRKVPEFSRSQREEFRHRLHDEFNEHTSAAVEQLLGRVKEHSLTENFEWQIAAKNGDQICLEAIPHDPLERLFYGSLRVSLDVTNGTVQKIVVIGRNQIQRVVWQADGLQDENRNHEDRIQLVQFEDGVPPAPSQTLRTAGSRFERRQ
jgi:hypothetical protein